MMRAIAIAATVVMCAACAGQDQQSDGVGLLVELVKVGLATTKRERMVAGGRQTDVARVRLTEAGRQALAKMSK